MTIKKIIQSISKKEWHFIILIVFIMSVIAITPYSIRNLERPADKYYNGMYYQGNIDRNVYYSYIEQVKQGNLLFEDLFTSEPNQQKTLNIFWLSTGLFGKIFNLSNKLTFEITKIILIPFFIFIIYFLSALLFKEKIKRKISLIFIIFASGQGWLFLNLLQNKSLETKGVGLLDMNVAEAFPFLTIISSPHFIASVTLLLTTLILGFLAIKNNKVKYSICSGVSALLLFQFHPFNIPTVLIILGSYIFIISLLEKNVLFKNIKHLLIIILISAPSVLYYVFLMNKDVLTYQKSLQNVCLTPNLISTICSYGFLLISTLLCSILLIKDKKIKKIELFLITWAIVQFILIYSPVNFQRRMTEGLSFPLALLSLIFFFYIFEKYKDNKIIQNVKNNYFLLIFLFLILFSFSNIIVFTHIISGSQKQIIHMIIYPPQKQVEAIEWLKENTNEKDTIMAQYINSNFIPAISGRHIFVGHGIETINFQKKYLLNEALFKNKMNDEYIKKILLENNINYIFFSLFEKYNLKWNPNEKGYLEKVFDNKEVQIYKIL